MNVTSPIDSDAVDHVVAIGASAGGLEALEALFDHLAPATGAAFVVITHLSPDFKSIMDELLARRTEMPVHVVADGAVLAANNVYVIPPGKDMIAQTGRLFLTDREAHAAPAAPIDLFIGSLARAYGPRATAVILSGTGADGAKGARALRAAGGYVIAQSPETARFDGMPRAVVETGAVDAVLPPEAIGAALAARAQEAAAGEEGPFIPPDVEQTRVSRILEIVLGCAQVDFSEYKRATILRRIARRMQVTGAATLEDYAARLETAPAEARALAEDLLIVVTEFFRDGPVWDLLVETVLPELLAGEDDRPIRIWAPAVGTGQEAYSIAMLLREAATAAGRDPKVQIFATDISPSALERAQFGVYSEAEMANVSTNRREAFFHRTEDGAWQVGPEIRNWIVFATHNMLRDPPFINTNLISCRNALIYFENSAQNKALSLFHFSLSPGGYLLLGPSESVGDDLARFSPIDPRWRLFRKRAAERRDAAAMGELLSGSRWAGEGLSRRRPAAPAARGPNAAALQATLELLAPPGLLVTRERELIHVVGDAQRHLAPPQAGPFTRDVLKLVRPALRAPLAAAIDRAQRSAAPAAFVAGEAEEAATLTAHPIPGVDGQPDRMFISFGPAPTALPAPAPFDRAAEQRIAYLEEALRLERDNLQVMLEQLETSNEELQSTNEELMTANEELQSTNEELHSVNEELYTVNAEYERKNDELTQLTKDVSSLLQATGVGVVFVDRGLTIRRFTATATRVLNLQPGDEGRRLGDITHRFGLFDLCGWLDAAMEGGAMIEVERHAADGAVWTVRAAPVRDLRGVSGAVVSLIEVTRLVSAEAEARAREAELARLRDWVGAASLQFDARGRLARGAAPWRAFTGQALAAGSSDGWLGALHPEDRAAVAAAWTATLAGAGDLALAARLSHPDGGWRPVRLAGGRAQRDDPALGFFLNVRDAAEAEHARRDAAASDERAAAFALMAYAGTYGYDPDEGAMDLDARLAALLGLPEGRIEAAAFDALLTPASRRARAEAIAARGAACGRWTVNLALRLPDGRQAALRDEGLATGPGGAHLVGALAPLDAARADAALAEEFLRASPVEVVVLDAASRRVLRANPAAARNLGAVDGGLAGVDYATLLADPDAADFADRAAAALAGGEVQFETFLQRADGSIYDVELTLRAAPGAGRLLVVARDLTERRRAEDALRRRAEAQARTARDLAALAALADVLAAGAAADPAVLRREIALFTAAPAAAAPVDLAATLAAAAEALGAPLTAPAVLPAVAGSAEALGVVFAKLFARALAARAAAGASPALRVDPAPDAPRTLLVAEAGGLDGFDLALCRRLLEAQGGALRSVASAGGAPAAAVTLG